MRPIILQCRKCIKVLKLSKSEKSGRGDDIDTEDLGQAVMVKRESVLESDARKANLRQDKGCDDYEGEEKDAEAPSE